MSKRMLIDGTHSEETRVVVTSGNRLEEYDVETSTKRQLKGNIYLAKVTRVEPSLQAAFVDYGGNRHGFLAFNEIHPDYYQIPIEDRQALLAEQADLDLVATAAQAHVDEMDGEVNDTAEPADLDDQPDNPPDDEISDDPTGDGAPDGENGASDAAPPSDDNGQPEENAVVDQDDAALSADSDRRRSRFMRRYRIQEVIRRRQILLVQVVKEERGNKGAALTTYISLAGRYCVLMPNTGRGGGISRKVTNTTTRRKMRDILNDLEIPEGMGVIMRTAGMERNRTEIKRDFEYLIRAWDNIRELTLKSTAPTLIYEEANLIKRAIRDLYTKEMDEVLIEGAEPYQMAKKFMRLLMPSHAKRVQPYRDEAIPLFHRFQVESQLDAMLDPVVQLKSGGYIVIHSTEALVAIDVNSGRSTRERNIEETALKTNIEAAEEVARQLRLRDLAGLIVIDFIDMEVSRNPRKVEKVLKDAMATDRARIQIGRISTFGLLELSRQRLRPSLQEASTQICRHCDGMGYVRSTESMAVRVLRALVEEGIRNRSSEVTVAVPTSVALYILNRKRDALVTIEQRYRFQVAIEGDNELPTSEFTLERVKARPAGEALDSGVISIDAVVESVDSEEATNEAADEIAAAEAAGESETTDAPKRPRRRRRGRKPADESSQTAASTDGPAVAPDDEGVTAADESDDTESQDQSANKRRRRGKRGGRRRSRRGRGDRISDTPHEDAIAATFAWARQSAEPEAADELESTDAHDAAIQTTFGWTGKPDEPTDDAPVVEETVPESPDADSYSDDVDTDDTPARAAAENGGAFPADDTDHAEEFLQKVEAGSAGADVETLAPDVVDDKPKRRGWWQRMVE